MQESKDFTKFLLPDSSSDEDDAGVADEIVYSSDESEPESRTSSNLKPKPSSFPSFDSDPESEDDASAQILKVKEVKRNGSTFAGMGLTKLALANIQRKGYKTPTPIQRKSMLPILDGKDVVGMARTGSGKTAAFVLPLIEKLTSTQGGPGVRGLILSPNRELAFQTLRTVKEFSKKTDLKSVLLVGGDSMEDQFGLMIDKPDIVVATPGRFLHLKVEMGLSLQQCEYIVFDEADRLFEMGFSDQLNEILSSLPEQRQTLLFSATLPPTLVEFAKAGLRNPLLVRLDAEQKVSEQLQMAFFSVNDSERDASLLYLLQSILKVPLMTSGQRKYLETREKYDGSVQAVKLKRDKEAQGNEMPTPEATIVFVPTKHHVEYVANLLKQEGYAVSYIYGSLDQAARREQLYLFRAGKTSIMVVTDVAARGVDIPLLANVVNVNLPTSARVFIHRVGRTARAGHSGWAYSLIREHDLPYLVDLEVFLGRKIEFTNRSNYTSALVLGSLPRAGIESASERLNSLLSRDSNDLSALRDVAARGERLYLKSREAASKSAAARAKEDLVNTGKWNQLHPLVREVDSEHSMEEAKDELLARLSANRVKDTVFEFKKTGARDNAQIMARRRQQIAPAQERLRKRVETKRAEMEAAEVAANKIHYRDSEFYMSHYEPTESLQDRGYSFNDAASKSSFQLSDEGSDFASKQITRWDKKKGKFVKHQNDSTKYIKGENGQLIPASLKSGRFEAWKQANRIKDHGGGCYSSGGNMPHRRFKHKKQTAPKPADKARDDYGKRKAKVANAVSRNIPVKGHARPSSELRSSADIQKERAAKQKRWEHSNQPGKKRKRN